MPIPQRISQAITFQVSSLYIEKTCLDHISGPGKGATTEPTTSGTGCCPGTGPFSPVSIVRATAERVTGEGSRLSADLVYDRDLVLTRGLRLYELSDIMYTTEVQYHNDNTLSSTIVYY